MPRLSSAIMIGVTLASSASGACRRSDERSPSAWANSIVRRASVIMDAEVVQEQNDSLDKTAILRPVKIYKGAAEPTYSMVLPRANGYVVTEAYPGFPAKLGEHHFVVLYRRAGGFETSVCDEVLLTKPAIKAAVIRKAGR